MKKFIPKHYLISSILVILAAMTAFGQGNAFNFQGRLNDGTNPANGSYDLQFRLYNALTGGAPIGSLEQRPNTTLINGVFSVNLDFGADAFNNPSSVFIEIGIRPNGSTNAYTILGPRQQLTVVPFAVRATNAANALNATNAATATTAGNVSGIVAIENGGTGSAEQNFVDLTTDQMIEGNKTFNGTISVSDITQPITANGLVKAMLFVTATGTITRCYNGITNVSTVNCGFSVIGNNGAYDINFGSAVNNRFITITPYNNQSASISATFETRVQLPNTMIVFLKNSNNVSVPGPFMIVLY